MVHRLLSGLDPEAYLADVIDRMARGHPYNRLGVPPCWRFSSRLTPSTRRRLEPRSRLQAKARDLAQNLAIPLGELERREILRRFDRRVIGQDLPRLAGR